MEHEKKLKQLKRTKPSVTHFIFLMSAGVLFAWSLILGITNPTIFRLDYVMSLLKMFVVLGVFGLIFSNKYTMWLSVSLAFALAIFIASGFFLTPEYPSLANRIAESLTNTMAFITGYRPHSDLYETIIIWIIFITIGLFVTLFSYVYARFSILFIGAALILGVALTSSYFSYTRSFYVFVFSILVFLIRDLHQKNTIHEVDASPFTKYIVALTAVSLLVAAILPLPREGFASGFAQDFIQRPFNFINDRVADITQSNEFSLRQVGFGGSGRLGGNVSLNDRLFMRIRTDRQGPIYLTGAVMDTYTGYSWVNRFNDEVPVDFNDITQNLELFEYSLWWDLQELERLSHIPVEQFALLDFDDAFFDEWRYYGFYLDPDHRIFQDEMMNAMIWIDTEDSWNWELGWWLDMGDAMIIDTMNSRLTSAFHTGMVHGISTHLDSEELSFLRDRDRRFLADSRMPNRTRYLVSFVEPMSDENTYMYSHSVIRRSRLVGLEQGWLNHVLHFITAFREFHGYSPTMISDVTHRGTTILFEDFLRDYLIVRAEQIQDMYTALPDEFPERIHELARTVTASATNDYERMRLLESYLRENFAYTLTPGASPQNLDFVDHFLFDIRQGYCVHFATAFVTMARSLGMPTRYVEGFLVHVASATPRNDEGFLDVLNNMAHAWAEVYFEGAGWVRFEPTPSSGLPQEQAPLDTGGGSADWFEPENPEQVPPSAGDFDFIPQQPDSGSRLVEEESEGSAGWIWMLMGIGFVGILIVARIIVVHIKVKARTYKTNNEAAIHLFDVMLSYFKVFKISIKADETARQFAMRICYEHFNDFYDDHLQSLLKETAEVFSKARYSHLSISNEERSIIEKLVQTLDMRMRHTRKWQYFYDHYVRIRH